MRKNILRMEAILGKEGVQPLCRLSRKMARKLEYQVKGVMQWSTFIGGGGGGGNF